MNTGELLTQLKSLRQTHRRLFTAIAKSGDQWTTRDKIALAIGREKALFPNDRKLIGELVAMKLVEQERIYKIYRYRVPADVRTAIKAMQQKAKS